METRSLANSPDGAQRSAGAANLLHRERTRPDIFVPKGESDLRVVAALSPTRSAWEQRVSLLRAGMLCALRLDPLPERCPLSPRIREVHVFADGRGGGYLIEAFAIEILAGLFATGNLYRPLSSGAGKEVPVALLPHGHDRHGRVHRNQQHLAATLARLGVLAATYDMQGFGEAKQIHHDWGGMAALQTWQSMRILDFVLSLPQADPARVLVTGYSGGATQAILLTALDPRVTMSAPVAMVSSTFYGGCMCESGLPIHSFHANGAHYRTNNAEIAAMASISPRGPRPLLLVSIESDWTALTPEREYPFIRRIYGMFEQGATVAENVHLADASHDYGYRQRQAVYAFAGKHWRLPVENNRDAHGDVDETANTPLPAGRLRAFSDVSSRPAHAVSGADAVASLLWHSQ